MLPIFLHFQYRKHIVCDKGKKSGDGITVLLQYDFCKDCAKKIIPIYQKQLDALNKEVQK